MKAVQKIALSLLFACVFMISSIEAQAPCKLVSETTSRVAGTGGKFHPRISWVGRAAIRPVFYVYFTALGATDSMIVYPTTPDRSGSAIGPRQFSLGTNVDIKLKFSCSTLNPIPPSSYIVIEDGIQIMPADEFGLQSIFDKLSLVSILQWATLAVSVIGLLIGFRNTRANAAR